MQHPTNDADFDKIIAEAGDKPCFLKFSAEWCPPCQAIKGQVGELATQYADKIVSIHVDVDALGSTSEKYGIEAMPTMMIAVKGEKQEGQIRGADMNAITAMFAEWAAK